MNETGLRLARLLVGLPLLVAVLATAAGAVAGESGVAAEPAATLPERIERALQRTRGTADPRRYAEIEPLLQEQERRAPNAAQSKVLRAWYDMSLHRFAPALVLLREAQALGAPDAISLGLTSDALVELGRYDEAVRVTQRMLDRYPGLPAMTRAAHLRFLYNDLDGAIELYRAALDAPGADATARAWVHLQLADLHLQAGQPAAAERHAAAARPYSGLAALLALGRIRAQQGRSAEALALFREALRAQPSPEYAFAAYEVAREASNTTEVLRQQRLLEGMARLDGSQLYARIFAAFLADLPGRSGEAVALAQREYETRPDLYSHIGLAWALYRDGDLRGAAEHCRAALRLDTPDPLLRYRGAVILRAAGDTERAQTLQRQALAAQPRLAGYEQRGAAGSVTRFAIQHDARRY